MNDEADHDDPITSDGVELTLIRWMLSLSPRERLQALQNNVRFLLDLKDAKERAELERSETSAGGS